MLKRENLPSFRFLPPSLPPLAHHYRLLSYWYYMQSSNERICPHRMNVCVCNFFPSNSGTHKRKQAQKKRTLFSYMDLSIAMFSYQTHWVVNWQKMLLSGRFFCYYLSCIIESHVWDYDCSELVCMKLSRSCTFIRLLHSYAIMRYSRNLAHRVIVLRHYADWSEQISNNQYVKFYTIYISKSGSNSCFYQCSKKYHVKNAMGCDLFVGTSMPRFLSLSLSASGHIIFFSIFKLAEWMNGCTCVVFPSHFPQVTKFTDGGSRKKMAKPKTYDVRSHFAVVNKTWHISIANRSCTMAWYKCTEPWKLCGTDVCMYVCVIYRFEMYSDGRWRVTRDRISPAQPCITWLSTL